VKNGLGSINWGENKTASRYTDELKGMKSFQPVMINLAKLPVHRAGLPGKGDLPVSAYLPKVLFMDKFL
jgi:hypothetical protein